MASEEKIQVDEEQIEKIKKLTERVCKASPMQVTALLRSAGNLIVPGGDDGKGQLPMKQVIVSLATYANYVEMVNMVMSGKLIPMPEFGLQLYSWLTEVMDMWESPDEQTEGQPSTETSPIIIEGRDEPPESKE